MEFIQSRDFYSLKKADLLAEMTTLDDIEAEEIKKTLEYEIPLAHNALMSLELVRLD